MNLVKQAIDVGIGCADERDLEQILAYWRRLGAEPDQVLPLGGGRRQHRHRWGESVLKLNQRRGGVDTTAAAGWGPLTLFAADTPARTDTTDPEGNRVCRAPGEQSCLSIGLQVRDAGASAGFFRALGMDTTDGQVRIGTSMICIEQADGAPVDPPLEGTGYRYVTLQVDAVDRAHQEALAAGGREGMAPTTLGDVARISFVREPAGNWIELSQRRSLTGSLEPV